MLQKVYHMYHNIKILEKVGSTNKPTFYLPQYTQTIEFTLDDMVKVSSDIHGVKILASQLGLFPRLYFIPKVVQNAILHLQLVKCLKYVMH